MVETKSKSEVFFKKSLKAVEGGQHKRAKRWLKIAKFYGHPIVYIHFQLGLIALEELNLTEALRYFHSYLSLAQKQNHSVYYYLGESYFVLGNTKEASKFFKMAFDEGSNLLFQCKALLYLDKMSYFPSDKIKELADYKFHYLLNIDSRDTEEQRIKALVATLKGNHEEAIQILEQVIEEKPKLREAHKELVECYLRAKCYEDAIDLLKKKAFLRRKYKTLNLLLAKIYYQANMFPEAKNELLSLLKNLPGNAKLLFNLANVYFKMEQYNRAGKYYLKAFQNDSQCYMCYFNLGVLYHKSGLLEQAEHYYKKVLEMDPSFSQSHYNLGILYYQEKNYYNSLSSFLEADRLDEKDNKAIHNFNTVKNIKLIDPDTKMDQKLVSMVNIYLFILVGLLLFLFIYLN